MQIGILWGSAIEPEYNVRDNHLSTFPIHNAVADSVVGPGPLPTLGSISLDYPPPKRLQRLSGRHPAA